MKMQFSNGGQKNGGSVSAPRSTAAPSIIRHAAHGFTRPVFNCAEIMAMGKSGGCSSCGKR